MTESEKLLEALRGDSMGRLRHLVLREAGLSPFSLRAALITKKQILRHACQLALDGEEFQKGKFDKERFEAMKEAEHGGI